MIRLADTRDAPAVQAIYAPVVRTSAISFEIEPPSAEEMAGRIAGTLAHYPWLVDETDGNVRGFVYASQHRTRAAYRWAADVTAYVAEGARRQGVGQRLYRPMFEILRRLGYRSAWAGITLPNPGSVGLHESLGFKPVGIYRNVGYKAGAWHDVGWWGLDLGGAGGEPGEPLTMEALGSDAIQDSLRTAG